MTSILIGLALGFLTAFLLSRFTRHASTIVPPRDSRIEFAVFAPEGELDTERLRAEMSPMPHQESITFLDVRLGLSTIYRERSVAPFTDSDTVEALGYDAEIGYRLAKAQRLFRIVHVSAWKSRTDPAVVAARVFCERAAAALAGRHPESVVFDRVAQRIWPGEVFRERCGAKGLATDDTISVRTEAHNLTRSYGLERWGARDVGVYSPADHATAATHLVTGAATAYGPGGSELNAPTETEYFGKLYRLRPRFKDGLAMLEVDIEPLP